MTRHRRCQLFCSAGSVLAGAGGAWCAGSGRWVPMAALTLGALCLADAAVREGRAHARLLARHRRAGRAALSDAPVLPVAVPCCAFWTNSDGVAHGPECTRPAGVAAEVERGWQDLHAACCLHGWESRGTVHDARMCTRRTAA